ncbi:hypothetical protein DFP72DRAFT_860511 [Ephemerocybe angulata]|uniref:Uncharacterized protein n=1 Tax=Ephemerocybe angulata TaxID=980116 RepID=A0A8H6HA93_9AGAR|nr:hypothetical protein DFP72DRAFT_860511 [Tulosesus angulatus]
MTNPPSHYIPKTPKPTLANLPGAFGPLTMEENDEKARQWLENRLEAPTSSPGFFGHKPAEIFEFPDDVYARQASPNTAAEYKKRAACSYMEQEARYAEEGFDELSDFVPETDETEDLEVEAAITASWEVAPSTSLALASPRMVYKAKAAKAQALCDEEIEECKYQIEELRRHLEFQEAKLTNAVYKKRRIEMHLKRVTSSEIDSGNGRLYEQQARARLTKPHGFGSGCLDSLSFYTRLELEVRMVHEGRRLGNQNYGDWAGHGTTRGSSRFGIYDDYKRHKRNNHKPPSNAERETEDRVGTKGVLNTRGSWFSEGEAFQDGDVSTPRLKVDLSTLYSRVPRTSTSSPVGHRTGFGLHTPVSRVRGRERLVTGFRSYPEGRARCGGTRRHEEEPESRSEANTREISRLRLRSYHLPHTLNLDCPQSIASAFGGAETSLGYASATPFVRQLHGEMSMFWPSDRFFGCARGEYDSGPGSRASTSIPSARLHPVPSVSDINSQASQFLHHSCADFAENDLKINGDYPQEIFDALFKGMDNAQIAAKLVELKYLYKVEVFIIHGEGSPYWLGNPSLGIKCSKLQSMLAILAKCTKPGETPLVDPELRERLGAIVTKCRRIKEGKMLPGDMAVSTWRDGKSGASGGAGASRGTKRPSTSEAAPANKTRVVAHSGGGSAAQNWRTPTQGPPNFYGVMRRTRELISTGDAESDGPEARILGGVMAIRTQMFGLESQIDVMQELWVGLGQQHDAKVEDLRNHLKDYEPLAPRIAPAHTVLPDDRSHVSRSAVAPTRRHELAEDRVVVNLRGTTRGPPPKAPRAPRSRTIKALGTPVASQVETPVSVPVEVPVASSSRDKGKARANPVRSTRAKKTWAEEVEAEDVRMVVSEGDVSEENEEDEIESGDESDLSELPKGYRSD